MILSAVFLWSLACILGFTTYITRPLQLREAFTISWEQLIIVLPRLPVALLAAGFITVLLPQELISSWIGSESGIIGVLIAAAVGVFVPSGPVISFPVAIALFNLGAGTPQLIAFLTGWSIFQLTRLLMWEVPFLGWSFAFRRLLVSAPLPFLAAGISALILLI